jgi:hypothetical protein
MSGRPSGGRFAKATKANKPAPAAPPVVDANTEALVVRARENLIDRAVHAGVINEGMRRYYRQAFDADPAGTRAFLGKIGLRGEAASATQAAGTGPDEYDDALLTPGERQRIAAAREGKPQGRFINGG